MPITVNEGGVLYDLDSVTSNENGVLYSLDTVHSNEGGTLYEIFSGKKVFPESITYYCKSRGQTSETIDTTSYTCNLDTTTNTIQLRQKSSKVLTGYACSPILDVTSTQWIDFSFTPSCNCDVTISFFMYNNGYSSASAYLDRIESNYPTYSSSAWASADLSTVKTGVTVSKTFNLTKGTRYYFKIMGQASNGTYGGSVRIHDLKLAFS